ncbi:MAG: delta-60 repeat domain-containing protein [Chloroflexota bacterium]|nr:delta-60 repeat domain-containing protein [Chloroflexota bacterium]MDQ5866933.1 delta-60 repeat domain-containing protein [Chloroflexota bacterium]
MTTRKQRGATNLLLGTMLAAVLLAGCGGQVSAPTATRATSEGGSTVTPRNTQAANSQGSEPYGKLDTTFGDGGKVSTEFGNSDEAHGMVVQPDGKIVVAGEAWSHPEDTPSFGLTRYNEDGSPDEEFGNDGKLVTKMTKDYDYSRAYDVALQEDGKIVAVGSAIHPDLRGHVFAIARYNQDGALDKTFGKTGKVLTNAVKIDGEPEESARAVAIQPDGKIVVVGATGIYVSDFAVLRYDSNGKLDTKFGKGGKVTTDIMEQDVAEAAAIQPDGKILVAGHAADETAKDDFVVVRYLPNGKLDTTFGHAGKVVTNFMGGEDRAFDMVLRPNGKIVLAGSAQVGGELCQTTDGITKICDKFGYAIAQYNEDGSLDESFGENGLAHLEAEETGEAYSVALREDGKLALGGHFDFDDFAVLLVNEDGTADGDFGEGGLLKTEFSMVVDSIAAVAFQEDGKLVAAGTANVNEDDILNEDFAITRYTLDR